MINGAKSAFALILPYAPIVPFMDQEVLLHVTSCLEYTNVFYIRLLLKFAFQHLMAWIVMSPSQFIHVPSLLYELR